MVRTNSRRKSRGYYGRYLAHYTKRNTGLLVLGLLFVLGVLAGTLLIRTAESEVLALLLRLMDAYVESRAQQGLMQIFCATAGASLLFVGALLVCGFCAISQPVSVAAPFVRGLGFGFSVSSLYAWYGVGATGYVALFLLPNMLLSTLAILICCREALRLSGSFLASALPDTGGSGREFYSLRIYLARFVAAGVLCLVSAFLEAVLYVAFANVVVLG